MTSTVDIINAVAALASAIFTLVIGVATYNIALYAAEISKAQIYPHLNIITENRRDEIGISLVNAGSGPALITRVLYSKPGRNDRQEDMNSVKGMLRAFIFKTEDVPGFPNIYFKDGDSCSGLPGEKLRAQSDPVKLVWLQMADATGHASSQWEPWQDWLNDARAFLDGTRILIEYKDALGNTCGPLDKMIVLKAIKP